MNSIHRVGLTIASLATILVVGGTLVVGGYMSAHTIAATATATPQPTDAPRYTLNDEPTATTTLEPQTVYIETDPTPAVVTISKPARPPVIRTVPQPTPQVTPPVVHVVVPRPSGGDDHGGGDD